MKSFAILAMAVLVASALAGCVASNSAFKLSEELRTPCSRPSELPSGALNAAKLEPYYARDRAALADCADKHDSIIDSIDSNERIGK